MYAQSLVTVFDECIIANLTADYYVNCQKDIMWTDIPQQGNFGDENRKYAKKRCIRTTFRPLLKAFPAKRCFVCSVRVKTDFKAFAPFNQ